MSQFKNSVGIDVAKKTLDIAVLDQNGKSVLALQIKNNASGLSGLVKKLNKVLGKDWKGSTLFCLEHTGVYCHPFLKFSLREDLNVWLQHALEIKRRSGMTRGKSDPVDAGRIAEYAYRYQDKVTLWEDESSAIKELRTLLSCRRRLMKVKNQFEAPIREAKSMGLSADVEIMKNTTQAPLNAIKRNLKKVEADIKRLLKEAPELSSKAKLIMSVPGIGIVTAALLLIHTKGFDNFDSPKQVATYCGVAPFPNQSGNSNKPNKISHLANKNLKTALHMAAMSAIQHSPEMKAYFIRKVQEGKLKMKVLNAVRNKLIHRAFAVVKRGTPYQKEFSETKENLVG